MNCFCLQSGRQDVSVSADNELTVGKVYAAHMIFDFYKQNRAKRLEEQNPSGAPQVHSFHLSVLAVL